MNLIKIYIAYNYVAILVNDKLYKLSLNSNILNKGIIVDRDKFIKKYLQFYKENKISKYFWRRKIVIIHNCEYHESDKENLYNIFNELNYKTINIINEKNLLKINKNNCYLIIDQSYRLFYLGKYNNFKTLVLDVDNFTLKELFSIILKRISEKTCYVIGEGEIYFENIEYYVYNNIGEFFLKNTF